MSQERREASPSKLAVTKLLAQAEVARRRALRTWLLATLPPVLIGAALLAVATYFVYKRLEVLDDQDNQIKANAKTIADQQAAIAAGEKRFQELAVASDRGYKEALEKIPNESDRQQVVNMIESSAAETTPRRVFIHIHDEAQREQANQVAQALRDSGYIVPGVERRAEKVTVDQVKFFRKEDGNAARNVAQTLAAQGMSAEATFVGGYRAPPGQLEVWFAPAAGGETPPAPGPLTTEQASRRVRSVISRVCGNPGPVAPDERLETLCISDAQRKALFKRQLAREFNLSPADIAGMSFEGKTVSDLVDYVQQRAAPR